MSEMNDDTLRELDNYGAQLLRPGLSTRVLRRLSESEVFQWRQPTLAAAALCGLVCCAFLLLQPTAHDKSIAQWQDFVESTQDVDGGF